MTASDEQRALLEDLETISSILALDPQVSLEDESRADWHTADLQDSLEIIVRGYVVTAHAILDELMDQFMYRVFLDALPEAETEDEGALAAQEKRVQTFTHHVLLKLHLLDKFAVFKEWMEPPPRVESYVRATNDLRNAVAHTLVLDKRRTPALYKKKWDVFTGEGFGKFYVDGHEVHLYLHEAILGYPFKGPP